MTSDGQASPRIHMSSPDVGELEESFLVDAVRSGWIAPLGPHVDGFESELANRCGRGHAVALSSGTAALHLALLQLGARPGTSVIVPTMTFAATANAVVYTGASPVFVDCDPFSGNLDPELLGFAMSTLSAEGQTIAAVMTVDLLGKCADHDAIEALCDRHGVPVLEDAAESLGSVDRGRPAGSFGAAAALSFNGNKIMTTSGGGALLTDDADFAARARYLSTQARQPVEFYEHTEVGYNYRMSNLLAALGRAQLQRLDEMLARRREHRERYARTFERVEGVEVFQRDGDESDNCWLTSLLVDPKRAGWERQDLSKELAAGNIESRRLWKPMHLQPVFREARAFISGAAERLFATGLTLPSGSALDESDVERIDCIIGNFLDRVS
ncbi:dTDP-4-amino-4,6-dideoxygalactose transaminase [Antricoccus suffuscus]|uniref:dTDP-4-amino-4,6-dideoxygalactose transaminase n=2 Tax=Antricoccus suffuscus TaxID=1629062 RepID=A0A2T1A6Q2_9ACTN|nr:dTDP-4-amino-4,6-dideoxygalactose transaminase [Antricoccus suffuscus]